jgi:hypothetical protein
LEAAPLRTVYVMEDVSGSLQSLYLDRDANSLRPNLTFVYRTGNIFFETNEIGLKGGPLDPARKLAVVWGDSVVFGLGQSWPYLLDDMTPGFQFLNGGIEGNTYYQVLDRAQRLNRERDIALNIILLGWHVIGYNENLKSHLTAALAHIPNPVLGTQPTAFNRAMIGKDISALFVTGVAHDKYFGFPGWPYSVVQQKKVFDHIVERNEIVRDVAASTGVPLVDMFDAFNSERLVDFRQYFFDYSHPRPSAYPKIARVIYEGIKSLVGSP